MTNTIYTAWGNDLGQMTRALLQECNLFDLILQKSHSLDKIPRDMRIMLKPNLVSCVPAEFGSTTHPEIVLETVTYLQNNGLSNIAIAEGSWVGDKTPLAFEYCGYNDIAAKTGVRLIDTQQDTFHSMGVSDQEINICDCVDQFDFLINIPVLKGHGQTKMTCALKNMKGLIPNSEKRRFHKMGLHMPIAQLNSHIKQDFVIVDNICGDMYSEDGGNPVTINRIMAGNDPVLIDSYCAALMGYKPEEIPYVIYSHEYGVGRLYDSDTTVYNVYGADNGFDYKAFAKMNIDWGVNQVDSCSACYSILTAAIKRLYEEGYGDKIPSDISIGQGFQNKTGDVGIGNCTRHFKHFVPGCPPSKEDVYDFIKQMIGETT